jgi:ribose-phosphate pyrophosphokinase
MNAALRPRTVRARPTSPLIVIAGSGNPALAAAVAARLGVEPAPRVVEVFPDGEMHVLVEDDVCGCDVWIVQPTSPPAERHLFELLLLADACRRAGCARLSAVVPYFGYGRQDRRTAAGEALGSRVAADALVMAGLDRLVVVDPHFQAFEAMLSIPVDTLSAVPLLAGALQPWLPGDAVVVAPDLGAAKLAERYAALLDLPAAHVRKTRISGTDVRAVEVVGPVRGRTPVLVDDMISTGATVKAAISAVLAAGARHRQLVAASHALLAGAAAKTLGSLPLDALVVTDTVVPAAALPGCGEVVSVAPLIAGAIARSRGGEPSGPFASSGG